MGEQLRRWSAILTELRMLTGEKNWVDFGRDWEGVSPLLRRLRELDIEPSDTVNDARIRAKLRAFVRSGELTGEEPLDD